MVNKIIMHLDMDSFFAACEIKENPKLRGLPVVIGADPKNGTGRGVVSTSSYEARKYGIHSAMPISKAYRLNPRAIFLPVNFRLYDEVSSRIMKILRNYSSKFQQISIDEAYLDITDKANDFDGAALLATEIKKEIMEKEGLTCSIGISANKLVAKIASDFKKPDGLAIIKEDEIHQFLNPLNVRKLYGVGPKTEQRLKELGINTIGELASCSREKLIDTFGVYGLYLSMSASGIGDDFVAEGYGRLSIGREMTFEQDIDDFKLLDNEIDWIAEEICNELNEEKLLFKTVSIKIRLHDFTTFTRAKTIEFSSSNAKLISNTAKGLIKEFEGNRIRLIGVRVSNLEDFSWQKTIGEFVVA